MNNFFIKIAKAFGFVTLPESMAEAHVDKPAPDSASELEADDAPLLNFIEQGVGIRTGKLKPGTLVLFFKPYTPTNWMAIMTSRVEVGVTGKEYIAYRLDDNGVECVVSRINRDEVALYFHHQPSHTNEYVTSEH